MVKFFCAVVGVAESVFSVRVDESDSVADLKKAVKAKKKNDLKDVDAYKLKLFLAKTADSKWLSSRLEDVTKLKKGEKTALIEALTSEDKELQGEDSLEDVLIGMDPPSTSQIHVLVVVPRSTGDDDAWSPMDPKVQLNLWKSVVRVSSEDVCSGTVLVVDQTPTHFYLMTNLHMWTDATFSDHLSGHFKSEIKWYLRLFPSMKTSGRKRKDADVKDANVAMQPRRKSPRTTAMKTPALSGKPLVVVEQLLPDTTKPEEVIRFSLDKDTCWSSSAAFDFAIFKVAVPRDNKLVRCKMSLKAYDTKNVDVFGFPGALQDQHFGHAYASFPAKITGWRGNQMILSSLSAPTLSGSALVCTKYGVPVGYIGGLDGSMKNKQYQSYAFTFQGLIPELPSLIPKVKQRTSYSLYSASGSEST
ncbi:Crinkler (CRN) family protein [Phytophthora infestans T30-4]|uniref:Crinkler (CRN) family protein n=1 Tax=Phytophthora infestans (strain T30-4) TaxID=403677 RepID=D0P1Y6_PHYIT|nr:Crinkler (CRN) family protein [Phytophthora infestans T30-4]EEY55129.1 Crinkler (CRN) family protein [Phytophthora infestans T30-4]|eukprot:XP_002895685.1 Crinkler (CRN) family protein [Phytophthora infestans T30-4]